MIGENPQAMVIMVMKLREERCRAEARRARGPNLMASRIDPAIRGRRLATSLGAVLVTIGQWLQTVPGERAVGGRSAATDC